MADKKISALTAATTPLAGTEVLPIVQSGATVKVAVSDLTAGRAVSATQLTLTTGNLIVANGQGVDFSATPGTGTSELLADYEEGAYIPTITCGTSGTITLNSSFSEATYTRIGRVVTVTGYCYVGSVLTPVGNFTISLPFAVATEAKGVAFITPAVLVVNNSFTNVNDFVGRVFNGSSEVTVQLGNNISLQDTAADQIKAVTTINFSVSYFTS